MKKRLAYVSLSIIPDFAFDFFTFYARKNPHEQSCVAGRAGAATTANCFQATRKKINVSFDLDLSGKINF